MTEALSSRAQLCSNPCAMVLRETQMLHSTLYTVYNYLLDDLEQEGIVVWRGESLPHSISYPLLMLLLQNVLLKYTSLLYPQIA